MRLSIQSLKQIIAEETKELGREFNSLDDCSERLRTHINDTVMPEVVAQGWQGVMSFLNAF